MPLGTHEDRAETAGLRRLEGSRRILAPRRCTEGQGHRGGQDRQGALHGPTSARWPRARRARAGGSPWGSREASPSGNRALPSPGGRRPDRARSSQMVPQLQHAPDVRLTALRFAAISRWLGPNNTPFRWPGALLGGSASAVEITQRVSEPTGGWPAERRLDRRLHLSKPNNSNTVNLNSGRSPIDEACPLRPPARGPRCPGSTPARSSVPAGR